MVQSTARWLDDRSVIGRGDLLLSLASMLERARLVTLSGPGGVGKTCVARAMSDQRAVVWVELAPVAQDALVLPAIATACGVAAPRDTTWLAALTTALREQTMLLVLDTCEHVREACAELCRALLSTCPSLTILATSRVPLGIPAEQIIVVPALDPADAQALFAARAAAQVPGFALDEGTRPFVQQICTRLDGLPLAIELAAARMPLLTIAQIAERLPHSLALLAAREPHLPARQRSLRATLDWSFALLAAAEQALFRRLAVFADSFDLAAVEVVCDLPDALDDLQTLVDAALLTIISRDETSVVRYCFHDVVRQYALARLQEAGEEMRSRRQLVAWARALADRAAPELEGEHQSAWLKRLLLERENLRAALLAAEQAGDADRLLPLVNQLFQFWNTHAIGEGRDWLQRALGLAAHQINEQTARAWNHASFLASRQSDYVGMRTAAETALQQALALEDALEIANAHYHLGIYNEMQHQLPQARDQYQQSLAEYQQLNHPRGMGNVLNGLAHVARVAGDRAAARGYYEQGLALARAINDQRTTMLLLISLGNLLIHEDWESAEALFAESEALLRGLNELSYLPYVANGLGECAYERGDVQAAASQYEVALAAARSARLNDMTAQMLFKLAKVTIDTGELARAVPLLGEGMQIYVRSGRTQRIAWGIYVCAVALQRAGYPARAVTLFAAGMQVAEVADFSYMGGGPETVYFATAFAQSQSALTPAERDAALAAGRALSVQQATNQAFSAIHLPPRAIRTAPPELQIFTFGGVRVICRGRELHSNDWVYGKTRELLLYLLQVESATKEQIGEALWPDASDHQLKQNFRMAIYHLRRALGKAEWITFAGGRYAFNRLLDYWHDEAAFTAALARAAADPANRRAQLQAAADLYRGDLALETLDSEELLVRREHLRQQALQALLELGDLNFSAHMYPAAAHAYRRVIAFDPYLEAGHRGLLRTLAHQGERGAALVHYQTLQALLRRDLAVDVDPATRALADAIKRGDPLDSI